MNNPLCTQYSLCQNRSRTEEFSCINVGVYETQKIMSVDGYELTFAVNVLAPYLLTGLLLDNVQQWTNASVASSGKIVNVSSISQTEGGGVIEFDNLQHEKG